MTSKIVVNNIEADAGVSTVTFNSNVVRGGSNLHSTGLALGAGSTVGAVTGVTTYYGDGSQLTGIDSTKIETGNTKIETVDTGSDGHVKVTTEGTERLRITGIGSFGFGTDSPQRRVDIVGNSLVVRTATTLEHASGNANAVNNSIIARMPYGLNPGSDNNAGARIGIQFTGSNDPHTSWGYVNNPEKSASIYGVSEDTSAGYSRRMALAFYTSGFDVAQTEKMRISAEGHVTKPSNAIFHAFDGGSDIGTNTDIVFGQERFDVGGGYNTSNGEYTAPATGYYHFYAQVYRQSTSDDSSWGFFLDTGSGYSQISESRMENDRSGDTGRGYATLQCSIYWYMTSGHKIKCRVTTPGNIHCNTTFSYFCGNLVG